MSIETVDTRPRRRGGDAGSARAPKPASSRSRRDRCPTIRGYFQVNRVDRTGRALPGDRTFLVNLTKRTVVRTTGDPDRLDVAAALRRGTRA